MAQNLPPYFASNTDFKNWLLTSAYDKKTGYRMADEFAGFLVYTLPEPRIDYYTSSDYKKIQREVTGQTSQLADDLGFFPINV